MSDAWKDWPVLPQDTRDRLKHWVDTIRAFAPTDRFDARAHASRAGAVR